jgi:Secretion system C-terminal sorting domain
LRKLKCDFNHLASIDVQGLTNLEQLQCVYNKISYLNLQGLSSLQYLCCISNQITSLNIQGLTNLQVLLCSDNQLTNLNVQGLTSLQTLGCRNNPISCLPFLPQNLTGLYADTTNISCLPNIPPNLQTTLPLCSPNNPNGCLFAARIYGKAYNDFNNNCTPDAPDILQKNILVQARNTTTQEIYTTNSNASGFYEMGLPTPATYEVKTIILNNNYWQSCSAQTIFLAADTVQVQRDMLIKPVVQCADVEVNHQLVNLARPCSTAVYKVSSFNAGTITATGLSAKITLPTELTMQTATYPFTDLGGGVYQFALPNVGALERDTFSFSAAVSCTAMMNQMLCTNVAITPNTYCIGGGLAGWDGSDIELSGRCIGSDSIRFIIKNVGQGGMSTGRNYGVIEDMVMIRGNAFQLAAGASDSLTVAANPSRIYRLIADEAPNNPTGTVQEQFMVWGCSGMSNQIHWGFVNNFGLNNGTSNPHQLCEAVRTSFDPNDISAKAEGVGAQRFILKNSDIEYKIRFQNTGNDTAFVVRLLDKLPNELDASTLRIGTGSHPFTWRLASNGVLEFLFQNILLADSMTNESASHGFITYRIKTKPNLANGTTISNQAGIYFDYNAPIMTNIYTHTIGENLQNVFLSVENIVENNLKTRIYPNPTTRFLNIDVENDGNEVFDIKIVNTLGQTVHSQTTFSNKNQIDVLHLPQGSYFLEITSKSGRAIAKIVVTE